MPYRTLEDLRDELRARLGFSASGSSAGVQVPILNSFLRSAQAILYWTHDWVKIKKYETKTLGANAYQIDYPTTANPERVTAVSILNGNLWTEGLRRGIKPEDFTYLDNYTLPTRWEPREQIEFNVKSDKAYSVRVFFVKALTRFTQDADRATIDDDLIFMHALGDAKAHYRHPDAKTYTDQRDALLIRLKAKSWGKTVFSPREYEAIDEPLQKPVVV